MVFICVKCKIKISTLDVLTWTFLKKPCLCVSVCYRRGNEKKDTALYSNKFPYLQAI